MTGHKAASPSAPASVEEQRRRYEALHDESSDGTVEARKSNYASMVTDYYDLVTDFYEFGWGPSFHFAPRRADETVKQSLRRHEQDLANDLGLAPGWRVLDVGCGVGGPMIEIARYSGATVTGVNNSRYQLDKARRYVRRANLADQCRLIEADFMNLSIPEASFDAIYSIEATCHAPDKVDLYRGLLRLLEPGAEFASYEWCLTPSFDAKNPVHVDLKKTIERGDALPDLGTTEHVVRDLRSAGFDVVVAVDKSQDPAMEIPWYVPLTGQELRLKTLPRTPIGRWLTRRALMVLEGIRIAPRGSQKVSALLNETADALVEAGKLGIFTPSFYVRARRPR